MARGVRSERPGGPGLRTERRFPPALGPVERADLKAAVRAPPRAAGIDLADWDRTVVREFLRRRCGLILSRSSCPNYLHRPGFGLERPKKRLLQADQARRAVFVRGYAPLRAVAEASGAKLFCVDAAHFYADADLRGQWVLAGAPALVDSTSPRRGEQASSCSAVCPETGAVEAMEPDGNSNAETSAAFPRQLRANHPGPLRVIRDNGPARGGDALRAHLATPDLHLRPVRRPGYSPDFNPDEAIRGRAREAVTATTCFGAAARVREHVGRFFRDLAGRAEAVKRRCRTVLQARAAALAAAAAALLRDSQHGDPTSALV